MIEGIDLRAPRNNNPADLNDFYTVNEIIPDYPSYLDSSWFYKLGDLDLSSGSPNSTWDTSYLYCFDYQFAKNTIFSDTSKINESTDKYHNFNMSYSFDVLINLVASVNNSANKKNIQIITVPEKTKYNTFELYNGQEITASYGINNEIYLKENEVFVVDKSSNNISVGDTLNLQLPSIFYTKYYSETNYDRNKSLNLSVSNKGVSSKYLQPIDQTFYKPTIAAIGDSEKNNDNIFAFCEWKNNAKYFHRITFYR